MSELTPFQVFDRNYQMAQGHLQDAFTYHAPANDETVETYAALRAHALRLASHMSAVSQPSPELKNAIDAVRESVMWANAGIALHGISIPSPEDPDDLPVEHED